MEHEEINEGLTLIKQELIRVNDLDTNLTSQTSDKKRKF